MRIEPARYFFAVYTSRGHTRRGKVFQWRGTSIIFNRSNNGQSEAMRPKKELN